MLQLSCSRLDLRGSTDENLSNHVILALMSFLRDLTFAITEEIREAAADF